MPLLILVAVLALQGWAWHRLSGEVKSGALTKLQAGVRYSVWSLVPLLVFLAGFVGAVGLEEWLGIALLSELMGRSTLLIAALLLAGALLGSVCFGVRCALMKGLKGTRR